MTDEDRMKSRIEIARDVIEQLNLEQIIATRGVYMSGIPAEATGELQDLLLRDKPRCRVCALGAMFLSHVRKHDGFDLRRREVKSGEMRTDLRRWFSADDLINIEDAFEQDLPNLPSNERLKFIMQWIIDHDGVFNYALCLQDGVALICEKKMAVQS